ncbi:MAG: transposase family protein [Planctomycetes bacterium]|nr:transposase family protein [Planctomycetota bacterium]
MDFFRHQALIVARVPRTTCGKCDVPPVTAPWARHGRGNTWLIKRLILEMARAMPIRPIAKLLRVSDNRVWRVLDHYVKDVVERSDCSAVTAVGVDKTSARRGHD